MASQIDQSSPTWIFIREWAEDRILKHQRFLETACIPQAETENTRGAIRELRVLLRLSEQAVIQIQDSDV